MFFFVLSPHFHLFCYHPSSYCSVENIYYLAWCTFCLVTVWNARDIHSVKVKRIRATILFHSCQNARSIHGNLLWVTRISFPFKYLQPKCGFGYFKRIFTVIGHLISDIKYIYIISKIKCNVSRFSCFIRSFLFCHETEPCDQWCGILDTIAYRWISSPLFQILVQFGFSYNQWKTGHHHRHRYQFFYVIGLNSFYSYRETKNLN